MSSGVTQDNTGLAVDDHGARAALAEPAAEFRGIELEIPAQHVKQRRARIGIDVVLGAVNVELHCAPAVMTPDAAGSTSAGCAMVPARPRLRAS